MTIAACVLVLAACGNDSDGVGSGLFSSAPGDLAAVKAALVDAGIDCPGEPVPYVADPDEMQIGDPPVIELDCGTFTGTEWGNANERGITMTMGAAMACGFGAVELTVVEAGPWAIGSEDDAGLTDSIAEALGVEPTVYDCDEITGGE